MTRWKAELLCRGTNLTCFAFVFNISPVMMANDYFAMVFITTGATAIAFNTPTVFVLLVQVMPKTATPPEETD